MLSLAGVTYLDSTFLGQNFFIHMLSMLNFITFISSQSHVLYFSYALIMASYKDMNEVCDYSVEI